MNDLKIIKAGIYGATGYTGLELARLLAQHPQVELAFVTSESQAGKSMRTISPQAPDLILRSAGSVSPTDADCVFLCLPHTESAVYAAQAAAGQVRVIDLSADLRLASPEAYRLWYRADHPAAHLLPVPYGLPELNRARLHGANLIANPGCYATAVSLGLAPLLRAGLAVKDAAIVVDAKSGTTGAGRTPKTNILFAEVQGNLSPYNIGRAHRHIAEIEQFLGPDGLETGRLIFSPHLLPTDRGILAAIYVQVSDIDAALGAFKDHYAKEPLVEILTAPELATLAHAVRTPKAVISLTPTANNYLIVVAAIDNLLKGAASQAVQNFNLMHALPETMGLLPAGRLPA